MPPALRPLCCVALCTTAAKKLSLTVVKQERVQQCTLSVCFLREIISISTWSRSPAHDGASTWRADCPAGLGTYYTCTRWQRPRPGNYCRSYGQEATVAVKYLSSLRRKFQRKHPARSTVEGIYSSKSAATPLPKNATLMRRSQGDKNKTGELSRSTFPLSLSAPWWGTAPAQCTAPLLKLLPSGCKRFFWLRASRLEAGAPVQRGLVETWPPRGLPPPLLTLKSFKVPNGESPLKCNSCL